MVIYGLYNLVKANYLLCALILLSATGLSLGWLFLRRLRNGRIVYRINVVLFGLLILYMLVIGGTGGSKILWMYTFPLIAFFLFGKKEGLFWSVGAIVVATMLFWNPLQFSAAYQYPSAFSVRFITTYVIVSAVTYWFEYFRYKYRKDIEFKNDNLQQEIEERKQVEEERERLIDELQNALDEVKTLSGFLPICASCKNIRDDKGYWSRIENYIEARSQAQFSHSICPDCSKKLYGDLL